VNTHALPSHLPPPHRPFRLIVTGGGSGGHTYPALTAVGEMQTRLRAHGIPLDVLWIGTSQGLEARVAQTEGIPFKAVPTGKLRRSANPLAMLNRENLHDMSRIPKGVVEAHSLVAGFHADVVLSTGGYVALPVGLAAKLTNTPLVVHEQTTRLGLANRLLSRIATTVALSFESTLESLSATAAASAVVTGNPVRPAVLTGDPNKAITALDLSGFDRSLPTVYVTGGTQGSTQINTLVHQILPWLLTVANVIHQCGAASLDASRQHAQTLPDELRAHYWPSDFIGPELPDVLALAGVVISRSGAGTIAELTALGKPSILIPLASSAGHEQEHNALHLQQAGAAIALVNKSANGDELRSAIQPLLTSPAQRAKMARAASFLGSPDAARRLVDVVVRASSESV
jgi:UDP-N-acetylglucosamine--N-acetylmuramyl-(pentapeptide) pyrophosphoryl-undecaprenol N-acetylglucosamine transferase